MLCPLCHSTLNTRNTITRKREAKHKEKWNNNTTSLVIKTLRTDLSTTNEMGKGNILGKSDRVTSIPHGNRTNNFIL